MAQEIINVGTTSDDNTGDTLRNAFIKTNSNFTELYTNSVFTTGSYSNPSWITSIADSKITFTDITTGNATVSAHGFLPKLGGGTTNYLRADGTWATPPNTTYSLATSTVAGLVELFSDTVQTVAANAVTSTASRTYGIQLNSAGQAVVNVPWVDTNTTYSAGNGISLSGTTFSVAAGDGLTQEVSGLAVNSTVVRTSGAQTIAGAKTFSDSVSVGGLNIRGWTATDTDIDALIPGSTSGVLLEGPANTHVVIGIQGNDSSDGLYIIDNNNVLEPATYSQLVLAVTNATFSYKNNAVLHAGNYNSYSPTLTGTGASGNWGINITGSAATLTTTRTIWGQNFNGSANVTGALTSVGNITGTGAITLTATSGTLALAATGANVITGTTNGTERFRIGSDGNVGIATTSPAGTLDVRGTFGNFTVNANPHKTFSYPIFVSGIVSAKRWRKLITHGITSASATGQVRMVLDLNGWTAAQGRCTIETISANRDSFAMFGRVYGSRSGYDIEAYSNGDGTVSIYAVANTGVGYTTACQVEITHTTLPTPTLDIASGAEQTTTPTGTLVYTLSSASSTVVISETGAVSALSFAGSGAISGNSLSLTGSVSYDDVSRYWLNTATNWGVYWDTTDNRIEFHGAGTDRWGVDLDTGDQVMAGDLTVTGGNIFTGTTQQRVKLGVWSDTQYGVGFQTGFTFGGLGNDYALTFQMNDSTTRGFWWGDSVHTNAQGAMALTTTGLLTLASGARIGFGESDTTVPTAGVVEINGLLTATQKSFTIKHPTKEGKKLRYGSLEGPENGVYIRGKLKGKVIELPEYWVKLVDPDSITVQLTPIGKHQKLFVEDIQDNKVIVGNGMFESEPHCFYIVQAERIDVDKLQVELD